MVDGDKKQGPSYKIFQIRHPDWKGNYWRDIEALYAGGHRLLEDDGVMERVFPQHAFEPPRVYAERRKRAFYIPYMGQLIDFIIAAQFTQLVTLKGEPEADQFYEEFLQDCSPPGGSTCDFASLLAEQMRGAIKKRRTWTLVEMEPPPAPEDAPATLAEQEKLGALQPYICPLEPECVTHWQFDEAGELEWARVRTCVRYYETPTSPKAKIREAFTDYERERWTRYTWEYPEDKPPGEKSMPTLVEEGELKFGGKVPIVPFEVPEGLWVGNKLASLAVEHFNARCALSHGRYKSLYQQKHVFLSQPDPKKGENADPHRATNQVNGIGYVWVGTEKDRVEMVGSDPGPFAWASQDLKDLRDEMHRIVNAMGQSVDNSGAALQRSAENKALDYAAMAKLLSAYGRLVREHAVRVIELVETARGDEEREWTASGQEKYDEETLATMITDEAVLETIPIPSETFQRARKLRLAKKVLGEDADEAMIATIEKELERNITPEQYDAAEIPTERELHEDQMTIERAKLAAPDVPPDDAPPSGKKKPPKKK